MKRCFYLSRNHRLGRHHDRRIGSRWDCRWLAPRWWTLGHRPACRRRHQAGTSWTCGGACQRWLSCQQLTLQCTRSIWRDAPFKMFYRTRFCKMAISTNVRGEPVFSVMAAGCFCEKSSWIGKVEDVKRVLLQHKKTDFNRQPFWGGAFLPR